MKFGFFFNLLYNSFGSYKVKELKARDQRTTYQCPCPSFQVSMVTSFVIKTTMHGTQLA